MKILSLKDKKFVIDQETNKSYSNFQLFLLSKYLFKEIKKKIELKENDFIYILSDTSLSTFILLFCAIAHGLNIIILDPKLPNDFLERVDKLYKPKILFHDQNNSQTKISKDLVDLKAMVDIILSKDLPENCFIHENKDFITLKDIKIITFTSGTESTPKIIERSLLKYRDASSDFLKHIDLPFSKVRTLSTFSTFYLGGIFNLFLLPLFSGWEIILSSQKGIFLWKQIWKLVNKYELNLLWLVPSAINLISRYSNYDDYIFREKLLVISGTDFLSKSTRQLFRSKTKLNILNTYGLSETLFISSQSFANKDFNSCGTFLEKVKIKKDLRLNIKQKKEINLLSQNENLDLERNDVFELKVDCPYGTKVITFDENNIQKNIDTKKSFSTGDLVSINNKNELIIVGRKKDLIIKSGVNISPKFIEDVLNKNVNFSDFIEELSCLPIPSAIYGQDICVVIKLKNLTNELNEQKKLKILYELLLFARQNLENNLTPDYFALIEKFPKTTSGKIIKSRLQSLLLENNNLLIKSSLIKNMISKLN